MADRDSGSGGSTQIIVATIGVVGVIAAALFGNWDKIFRPPPSPSAPAVVDAPAGPVPQPVKAADPVAYTAAVADVSGSWHDDDGYSYVIDQNGERFSYNQFKDGAAVGTGMGQIDGRRLAYSFSSGADRGACRAELEPGNASIAGICAIGSNSWPFRVVR